MLFTSCTSEPIEQSKPQAIPNITLCGTPFSASTIFTTGSPSTFVGVRYEIILDFPYNLSGTNYNKASVILNDAQNTPLLTQYLVNGSWVNFCSTKVAIGTTAPSINQFYLYN